MLKNIPLGHWPSSRGRTMCVQIFWYGGCKSERCALARVFFSWQWVNDLKPEKISLIHDPQTWAFHLQQNITVHFISMMFAERIHQIFFMFVAQAEVRSPKTCWILKRWFWQPVVLIWTWLRITHKYPSSLLCRSNRSSLWPFSATSDLGQTRRPEAAASLGLLSHFTCPGLILSYYPGSYSLLFVADKSVIILGKEKKNPNLKFYSHEILGLQWY